MFQQVNRQTFTIDLKDNTKESIEAAKKLMFECASEMGFTGYDQFKVQRCKDEDTGQLKWRMDVNFHV